MLRPTVPEDFETMLTIINDAAQAYAGVIPADCYHQPYMPADELAHEISAGVIFWGYEAEDGLAGVMGIQNVKDVTLIPHAYVRTARRQHGIGSMLLNHLLTLTQRPVLVGTWATAHWAIQFYQKHGFTLISPETKIQLLSAYWNVSPSHMDASVVLANQPESAARLRFYS